jgi:hypothetical protein
MELPKPWRYLLGAVVCAVLLACFGPVLWQGRVFYSGDMSRLYIPTEAALQRSLRYGRLPWWSSELGIGYPLVAEGEVAALYPFTWVFSFWLAPEAAITAQVLLHYALMLLGAYLYGCQLGLSHLPAALMGVIWAFSGFNLAHLSHVSILRAATWLPWLLWLMGVISPGLPALTTLRRIGAFALVVALQWLAGHPQMALLNSLLALAYGLWLAGRDPRWGDAVRRLAMLAGAGGLGLFLALPQVLPSLELVLQSQRAGGLDPSFFTSYSYSPLLTGTWVSPFLLGNPYPDGSVELMFYVGLAPLALALVGILRSRGPVSWWLAGLGVLGWLMSWGRWNPVYPWLHRVPVLNLFRVPARYLSWTGWALACLAGIGAQAALRTKAASGHARTGWYGLVFSVGFTGAALAWAATWRGLEQSLTAWRWLPILLAGAMLSTMLARRVLGPRSWLLLLMLSIVVDLYAYQRVLLWTYSETAPRSVVSAAPEVLETVLALEGRVYVKDEIVPARSVQEASLYPNLGLKHGVPVLNLYLPLVPSSYAAWLEAMDSSDFDMAVGSGYVIPQLLPVDSVSELYDVRNELAALPYETWIELEPARVASVEVISYLSHSAELADGTLAARLLLRDEAGEELALPLRAGFETAEWAYDREDVLEQVEHRRATIARSFVARSGFPPRSHPGHTYSASWEGLDGMQVTGARIEPILPEAHVRVEDVRLILPDGGVTLLSHSAGLGSHHIIYRSEDVVVYKNGDAFPRAWWASVDQVRVVEDGLMLVDGIVRDDITPAEIVSDDGSSLVVRVDAPADGYLVLADLYYPGWNAYVQGERRPILSLEEVFRAVQVRAGRHEAVFRYEPLRGIVSRMVDRERAP